MMMNSTDVSRGLHECILIRTNIIGGARGESAPITSYHGLREVWGMRHVGIEAGGGGLNGG